tara:strand:+ start:44462 stop:45103 length:642 start_codon:yes stop_codon:yes gene_type:complete
MNTPIIFDFDGTLVDSAPGILAAFDSAFSACRMTPNQPLNLSIIGPPLMETLGNLTGTNDMSVLQPLAKEFRASYDEEKYQLTGVFPGVEEMLIGLRACGYQLYIATNKRIIPTRRILEHLGWEQYFKSVYALDSFSPPLKSKVDMLGVILADLELDHNTTLYIGDRQEDGEAALVNNIHFLLAVWGYDESDMNVWERLFSPDSLIERLGCVI